MTITNEPTTTREVPAWLNLDGYCPPELRERIATARAKLAAAMPTLEELGQELAAVNLDVWEHLNSINIELDDHWIELDPWTGIQSLYEEALDAADQIATAFDGIRQGSGQPGWYLDMLAARLPEPTTIEEVQS